MQSPFTWIAFMVFTGLVALMLQRSAADKPVDKLWFYVPPAVSCAAVDYLGNRDFVVIPVILLVLIVIYIITILRPTMRS